MKMSLRSICCLLLLTVPILAAPEGYYHQEYQYQQSASSFKNNELQHKKDDEGFYTKDGDLTGSRDPKVNEQHQHREFINPKLRAQGYTEEHFAGSGLDLRQRGQQLLGTAQDQFGTSGAYNSAYRQNAALQSGTTLSSAMQSFMTNLQYDMQRQLERQLQQWRQDQDEYAAGHDRNRYYTSSGLYSPSTTSVDTIRRELQDEIRTNLTREIDLRNRVAQTQYDSTDLNDIKGRLQENLMRQLNVLMQEQQARVVGTQPTNIIAGTNTRQSSSSSSVRTKSASTQTNYNTPSSILPYTGGNRQYSSHEQDDLNNRRYYQERPVAVPEQYQYTPSSGGASTASRSANTYGSTPYSGTNVYTAPIIRNTNQITEIAQQVQNDMQQILIKALDQYQTENTFTPSNKYHTKPDYLYARQDFESRLNFNLTELFQATLERNFGQQDLRDQHYFSRNQPQSQQRYANYKQEDYDRLKQQVTENLQNFLRDSLKTQEEYYESQQRAYASSSSYTAGQVRSAPYQEDYRPYPSAQGGSSRSYSSSSSYSGLAAYQAGSRPQQTYYPNAGYRATSDTTLYGTFAKYQGDQPHIPAAPEDCDEGMQGDDPSAYTLYQRPLSYRQPMTSAEDYQRPINNLEDYQRPVTDLDDYQRPVSRTNVYERPRSYHQRPAQYNNFYDSERSIYGARPSQSTTPKNAGQFSVDTSDYDDDIQVNQKILNIDDMDDSNVNIEVEATTRKIPNTLYTSNQFLQVLPLETNSLIYRPTTERIESSSYEQLGKAQIDEIAQKLKDSVEEFHGNVQQVTLDEDDVEGFNFEGQSTTSTQPTNFNDFYGTTAKMFSNQNGDLLRVVKPPIYYRPYSADVSSSTPRYVYNQKTTPQYDYFNRQPFYGGNTYAATTTEAPKMVAEHFDLQQHHVEDSYEDFQVQRNPAPNLERKHYGFRYPYRPATAGLTREVPVDSNKPTKYQEDDQFLENALRQPKAINYNDDDENEEDFAQRPVDDNQEVIISSHRGDIDSFAKPNVHGRPVEVNRDLPIRLAEISQNSRPDFQHSDDLQRPLELQEQAQLHPIRLTDVSRSQNVHRPSYDRNSGFDLNSDDLQRPLEDIEDVQQPSEDFHDVQRPLEDVDEDYDHQFQGHVGRRLPEAYRGLPERPQVEVVEDTVQKLRMKPIYLSSDYNLHEEEQNLVESVNATETQNNPGFWKQFSGKISNTYNSAKQKAREIAEQINLL